MMQQEPKQKRRRTRHTAVRTGCYTCKYVTPLLGDVPLCCCCCCKTRTFFSNTSPGICRVRHKKCDETRPGCINCSSTGRKCDGYAEIQSPRGSRAVNDSGESLTSERSQNTKDLVLKSHVGLPLVMADPGKVGLSMDECFFLDFFRNIGPIDFVGYPGNNFLYRVVRQIGESQPSVKHAAMALTSLGHSRARLYFGAGSAKQKDFVLRQTSKAITHLLQQSTMPKGLSNRRAHREVMMTMCGVLSSLARYQNDAETMKMHLKYGQRAMQEWREADFDGSSIAPTLSAMLADLNWKLQIAANPASFLRDDNPLLLDAPVLSNFNFSNIEYTVNGHWDGWSSIVLDDRIPNGLRSLAGYPDRTLAGHVISFLFKVRIFTRQLKTCIEQAGHSPPQSIQDLLTALRLWDQVACAMVAAALADDKGAIFKPSHMKYDAVWAYFRRINEFGKRILQSLIRQNASTPILPIEWAVGTPLFFCGYYCRDWSTRREALRLLKVLGERFKGSDAAAFIPMKISALERIIDIESRGLQPADVVPELARIIQYVIFTGCPGTSNICFSYRPVGMDGLVEIL